MENIILKTLGALTIFTSFLLAQTPSIDVMAIYTKGANEAAGGDAKTKIEHFISVANQVYKDSEIDAKLNLVETQEVNYTDVYKGESGYKTSIQALGELRENSSIDEARKANGADIVLMFRPYVGDGACGIAYINGRENLPEYAFGHISIDCPSSTTVHEVGHILGLSHSQRQDDYAYKGYGTGYGVDHKFVTVMAYEEAFSASTIYKHSNPALYNGDELIGVESSQDNIDNGTAADAARTINETANYVSAYLKHKKDNNCSVDNNTYQDALKNYNSAKETLASKKGDFRNAITQYRSLRAQKSAIYRIYRTARSKYYRARHDVIAKTRYHKSTNTADLQESYAVYRDSFNAYRSAYQNLRSFYSKFRTFYTQTLIPSYRAYRTAYSEYNTAYRAYRIARKDRVNDTICEEKTVSIVF